MHTHWIISIYRLLLALFPAAYREKYGQELLYAVRMSVERAQSRGRLAVMRLAWRELRDLPGACLRAHLRERTSIIMKLAPGAHLPEGPFEYWQLASVFLPFSIALLGVVLGPATRGGLGGLVCGIGVLLLGLLVIVWITGLAKAFPTWALPSLGLILLFIAYGAYVMSQGSALLEIKRISGSFWPDSIRLRLLIYLWFNLVYVAIVALIIIVLLALSPQLLQLARKDWSLLSFCLYTLAIPYAVMNDEFHGLEPYQLVSLLILATGAALFILLPARWTRLLVLLASTLLALPTLSLGLYQIFPAQEFATTDLSFRVWEALQPVLDLPALLIILCLPVSIRFPLTSPPSPPHKTSAHTTHARPSPTPPPPILSAR
jgi:hypothetical protein